MNLASPAERERLSPGGIRAFLRIAELWKITSEQARELLGGVDEPMFAIWQADPEHAVLDEATLTRISLAIGIFKALTINFGQPLADQWITLSNSGPMFAGKTPIEFMIEHGELGMRQVRRLVDA